MNDMTTTEIALTVSLSAAALIFLILLVAYVTYVLTFRRRKRPFDAERDLGISLQEYKDIDKLSEIFKEKPYEQIVIQSYDGLSLVGRYYHYSDGAPLDILFHGYRSSPTHDFCGGVHISFEAGHNVLLVYQRSHGKSSGRAITFGEREQHDVVSWVNYAIDRFGEDVIITLTGISMGASTVILASALPDLSDNVKGIIADCPYSNTKDIIIHTVRGMKLPPSVFYPFIRLGGIIFARFDPSKTSMVEAAKHSRVPILLIHGEDDSFVPKYMSDEIYRAHGGRMDYHVFPGANHGLSFLTDPERYKKICRDFVLECHSAEGSTSNNI